eukprot:TRINITY_DN937_c0_g1_i14.p1 TRINITY_DN937_c0_g1~~TRINITY_DN937_c0_g1_i14.p1  ORF type:complete len:1064 (+),score=351.74 TRINITY_DN937_c0_g1_i14:52-3243(+)
MGRIELGFLLFVYLVACAAGARCKVPTGRAKTLHINKSTFSKLERKVCEVTANFTTKHPDVGMESVDIKSLFGRTNRDDDFSFLQNMLDNKDASYEVMDLNTVWVTTLAENLVELDVDPNLIRKKWRVHVSPNGKLYTLTRQTNQMVAYYRKDLFDKHNLTWPATWEEFETTLATLVEKEHAGGNTDFEGVVLRTDPTSQTAIEFMLVTLMSGFEGAGSIVEADGNVTVNNPAAAKAIAMWKRWIGTIAPTDLYGYTGNKASDFFKDGKAAVLINWSSSVFGIQKVSDEKGWNMQMASIPGKYGAGCSNDWSIGINKHSPLVEEALDLMTDYAEGFSFFDTSDKEPARQDVMDRPGFWDDLRKVNPMLATSMQTFPGFWDRLVHRPSAGCKALTGDCSTIIFKHIKNFFLSDITAEQTVAAMEEDLKVLLGLIDISGADYTREEWTDTRVAMLGISVFSAGMLVGIIVTIIRNAKSLRKKNSSFKVPVSVMLGVVALTSFAVVLGVVVTRNDTAIRDISEDLSERLRQQSMLAMEISVHGTIESLVTRSSVTHSFLLQRILGVIKQDIARMRVPARSLIVLIDRRTREVLLANDEQQQPVGVEVMGPGVVAEAGETVAHPWVSGALASIENWNTSLIDPERSYLYSSGEKVYASMLNIQQSTFDTNTVDWLVVYITPHVVIMGDAEDAYEEAIDLSVMLAALGVVVLLACAVVITQPFISLVRDMKHVENMEMDKVVKRDSILLEVSALLSGFYAMCDILNEYKAYMPASLFQKEESDTEDDLVSLAPSKNSKNSQSSRTGNSSSEPSVVPVIQMKMQATVKNVSLVSIWYPGDSVAGVTAILDAVSTVTQGGGRGALLSTSGDQSIIGLNITTNLVGNIMKACQCAILVRDRLDDEFKEGEGIGIGVATGKATVASCGSLALKAFTALGKVMRTARYLSEKGYDLKTCVTIENPVSQVVNGYIDISPVAVFGAEHKRSGNDQVIFRVGDFMESANEEWMYALARNATEANSQLALLSELSDDASRDANRRVVSAIEAAWLVLGDEMPEYLNSSLQELIARFG